MSSNDGDVEQVELSWDSVWSYPQTEIEVGPRRAHSSPG